MVTHGSASVSVIVGLLEITNSHATMTALPLLYLLLVTFLISPGAAWTIGPARSDSLENLTKHSATQRPIALERRDFFTSALISATLVVPLSSNARCTDIDSCREIGERKDATNLAANPITRLGGGLEYKVLTPGLGGERVTEKSKIKLIYSISQANGSYMYSRGFGYNKIDLGDAGKKKVSDLGLDSLSLQMGSKEVPIGIQRGVVGMTRGERRRINCPASLGFETSDWNPQPTDFRGRQQIKDYQSTLKGRGSTQPPFAAPTIWDVEVVSIR
jgi:hypothetical protein